MIVFAAHVAAGTVQFLILAAVAIGIDLALHNYLNPWGVSDFVIEDLTLVKKTLLAVDSVLLVLYVVRVAWRTLRDETSGPTGVGHDR